jgi:hypothetical protein
MNLRPIDQRLARFRFLLFILAAAMIAFSSRVATPMATSLELFHEGESCGSYWHMQAYQKGEAAFPLLIHGAMDFIPSQIAGAIYGPSRIIGGTRIVHTFMVCAAWVLFMELGYRMLPIVMRGRSRVALPVLAFLVLSPPFLASPIRVTESFVGIRDLGLTFVILACYHYWHQPRGKGRMLWLVLGCLVMVPAFFWCYDRGLMTVGLAGVMALGMVVTKEWRDLILAGVIVGTGTLFLHHERTFGSISENVSNVMYWMRHSRDVWGLPFDFSKVDSYLGGMLLMLTFCVGWLLVTLRKSFGARFWFFVGLLVIQILLAKTSLNRPHCDRVLAALFPSILLIAAIGGHLLANSTRPAGSRPEATTGDNGSAQPLSLPAMVLIGTTGAMFLMVGLIHAVNQPAVAAYGTFFRAVAKPRANAKLVPPELNELTEILKRVPDSSSVGWCNEGILQVLTNQAHATRFPYAVYAAPSLDPTVLAELKQANPQVIVSRPTGWSMSIDDRSMASRLPQTASYIDEHYPQTARVGGYVIHQRKPDGKPADRAVP